MNSTKLMKQIKDNEKQIEELKVNINKYIKRRKFERCVISVLSAFVTVIIMKLFIM